MTTASKLAGARSRGCAVHGVCSSERVFAMLGLFAALTYGTAADAQAVSPGPRIPTTTTPPAVAPPAATPPAPAAPQASPATPAPTTSTSTTTTTTTTTPKDPAAPAETTTTRSETTTVTPVPNPSASEQLQVERTEHKLEVKEQLSTVDAQLEHLGQQREERGQVTGPISMVAAGYTTGVAGLATSIAAFVMAQQIKHGHSINNGLDINNDHQLDGDDENAYRNISRTMGAVSAVGFAVGVAGSVFLAKRLKERRELDPEVKRLQNQRRELRRELSYSANASGTGLSFGLNGRF
jgi:hypothetical protein